MVTLFRGAAGYVCVDERHLPIIVTRWEGRIGDTLLKDYFDWKLRRFNKSDSQRSVVFVHDVTRVHRVAPSMRAVALRLVQKTRPVTDGAVIQHIAVANSPVIRGTLQALNWMGGKDVATVSGSLIEALGEAERSLLPYGITPPLGLVHEEYSFPSVEVESA